MLYKSQIKVSETEIGSTEQKIEEKWKIIKLQAIHEKNIQEENQLFVGDLVKKGLADKTLDEDLAKKH